MRVIDFLSSFAGEAFISLATIAAKATLLLTITLFSIYFLRRASAAIRHAVLFFALAMLLFLPVFSKFLPAWGIPLSSSKSEIFQSPAIESNPSDPQVMIEIAQDRPIRMEVISGNFADILNELFESGNLPLLLINLWIAGCLVFLARYLYGFSKIRKMTQHAHPIKNDRLHNRIENLRSRLALKKLVRLLESDRVSVPMTYGFFRPIIILPTSFKQWSGERLRLVLLHELAHIKRFDWVKQVLAQLAGVLHWFNPLFWMVYHRFRIDREQACDDFVLASGAKSSDYATHLLEIASALNGGRAPLSAAIAMAKKSQLEGRLLAILDSGKKRAGLRRPVTWLLVALMTAFSLSIAAFSPNARQEKNQKNISKKILDEIAWERGPEVLVIVVLGHSIGRKLPYNFEGRSIDFLRESLNDKDWQKRAAAAYALGSRFWPQPSDLVIKALQDERWEVRHFAVWAAERSGDDSLIEPLKTALKDPKWEISHLAVQALVAIDSDAAIEPLIEALQHPSWYTAHLAAWQLGKIGDQRAIEPLIAALSNDDWMTRHVAAWALGELSAQSAVTALIAALDDEKWEVRKEAAKALGRIGDELARPHLTTALNDAHEKVRAAAKFALDKF